VVNLMVEAPTHVKGAMKMRRTMRRARRFRKWRRPTRNQNRLARRQRLAPSTRSRWEAKARVLAHLAQIVPLRSVVVEDVQAVTRPGNGRKWNAAFSPVQMGKQYLYTLLTAQGWVVHLREGWQTKALREQFGLNKTRNKGQPVFASHAVDAWVLAASVSGATQPTCQRLWYVNTRVGVEAWDAGAAPSVWALYCGWGRSRQRDRELTCVSQQYSVDPGREVGPVPATHVDGLAFLVGGTYVLSPLTQGRRRGFLPSARALGLRRARLMSQRPQP
jgi:hypothetical protein